jgi:hypothetical protein
MAAALSSRRGEGERRRQTERRNRGCGEEAVWGWQEEERWKGLLL